MEYVGGERKSSVSHPTNIHILQEDTGLGGKGGERGEQ